MMKNNLVFGTIVKAVNDRKIPYNKPVIKILGRVEELTLGNGGTSLDGNDTYTQHGVGNNNK